MNSENRQHTETPRDPVFIGAEAAMHRAAKRARQLAAETARNAAGTDQVEERPGVLRKTALVPDPSSVSFSQAQGYEEMPGVLKLEELPEMRERGFGMYSTLRLSSTGSLLIIWVIL